MSRLLGLCDARDACLVTDLLRFPVAGTGAAGLAVSMTCKPNLLWHANVTLLHVVHADGCRWNNVTRADGPVNKNKRYTCLAWERLLCCEWA